MLGNTFHMFHISKLNSINQKIYIYVLQNSPLLNPKILKPVIYLSMMRFINLHKIPHSAYIFHPAEPEVYKKRKTNSVYYKNDVITSKS